jgi:hypothetical protein
MANPDSLLIGITVQLQLSRLLHTIKTRNFVYCWNRKYVERKQLHVVRRYLCVEIEIYSSIIVRELYRQ